MDSYNNNNVSHLCRIWSFKTGQFTVEVNAYSDDDIDMSFDITGKVARKLDNGTLTAFTTETTVTHTRTGIELASVYLGGSIYEDPKEFRDHLGINKTNCGSYFSENVREALNQARDTLTGLRDATETLH